MTAIPALATSQASDQLSGTPGEPRKLDGQLHLLRRVSWALFGAQFIGMAVWSAVLWSHFALTKDASPYFQQLYLIAHGHLDPFNTVQNHPGLQDHFSLAIWPIGLLTYVWPHALIALWLQDAAMVGAEIIAFKWICKAASTANWQPANDWWPIAVASLGLLLLVGDPWTYWVISWDIHIEPLACPFLVAAAYDFSHGRNRRAWLWVAVVLMFGDVTTTWVVALGLSALLAAYRSRGHRLVRTGTLLLGAGAGWSLLIGALGANKASGLVAGYGYLAASRTGKVPTHLTAASVIKDMILHSGRAISKLWSERVNIVANLIPAGVIGLITPWTIGVIGLVILEDSLRNGQLYSVPVFQSAPVYPFAAIGIAILLLKLNRLHVHWRTAWLTAIWFVLAINLMIWAVVWIPPLNETWLRVTGAQAQTLSSVLAKIPSSDEVIVSQGVAGRFAARENVHLLASAVTTVPVTTRVVWFVIAPNVGIETESVSAAYATIARLAGPLHARIVVRQSGVFALRWQLPRGLLLRTGYLLTQTYGNGSSGSGGTAQTATLGISGPNGSQYNVYLTNVGETLFRAASRIGTVVTTLRDYNPNYHAGQVLVVPDTPRSPPIPSPRTPTAPELSILTQPWEVPGWALTGPAGIPIVVGAPAQWHMTSNGKLGYVADGDYWFRPLGNYVASVSLSAKTAVNVEVWDDNGSTLLGKVEVPGTSGVETLHIPFSVERAYPPSTRGYAGWGPFQIAPIAPNRNQVLEIRIWTAGGGQINVYNMSMSGP